MILRMLSGSCNASFPQRTKHHLLRVGLKYFLFASSIIYMLSMLLLKRIVPYGSAGIETANGYSAHPDFIFTES